MFHLISISSNYILLIMCAIYAISSFTVYLSTTDEKQSRRMNRQEKYVFFFQIVCFLILFMQTKDRQVLFLCVGQLVFFKILILIYSNFYQDSSRILMNHTCFLLSLGFVMLARLSLDKAIKQFEIVAITSAICLFIPWFLSKAHWLKRLRWVYGLGGLAVLSSVFVIGIQKNGSTNWISLGSIQVQPSEFVKICFVFYLAATLSQKLLRFRTMFVLALLSAAHVIVLVTERDLGGALLYFILFLFMCYVATGRSFYMIGGLFSGVCASLLAYVMFSHVRTRVAAWLDPWADIEDKGYQIAQSLFAIGTGGWFGMGLTQGRPGDIPIVDSDFIFSAISEEFGMAFAICLLLVYLALFIHFINIAMDVEGKFYKFLAYGFSICFILQVFLSVGGVTKFIPSTGITLPLISYGGSSVCSTLIIFAVMQGIFMIAYPSDEDDDYGTEGDQEVRTGEE